MVSWQTENDNYVLTLAWAGHVVNSPLLTIVTSNHAISKQAALEFRLALASKFPGYYSAKPDSAPKLSKYAGCAPARGATRRGAIFRTKMSRK